MLDFGWAELFLIVAVGVLVIGPKEIPRIMRGLGRLARRIQYMKFAFTQQFDEVMREADLDDIRKQVNFEEPPEGFNEADEDEEYFEGKEVSQTAPKPDKK